LPFHISIWCSHPLRSEIFRVLKDIYIYIEALPWSSWVSFLTQHQGWQRRQGQKYTYRRLQVLTLADNLNDRPLTVSVPRQEAHDPEDSTSFWSCNEKENQTSAYMGYGTTNNLCDLAASWPLLRVYVRYHAMMDNIQSHDALQLLHTSFQELQSVSEPEVTWLLSVDQVQDIAGARLSNAASLNGCCQNQHPRRKYPQLKLPLKSTISLLSNSAPIEVQDSTPRI
jgi:hypothetical protein